MEQMVSAYEQGEGGKVLEIIQFNMHPDYKRWKAELERKFHPYVLS
jgi:hypothetical protein